MAPFVCGATGSLRDLDYVLWEMRFAVLHELQLWKLRAQDVWTVVPAAPAAEVVARVERAVVEAVGVQM